MTPPNTTSKTSSADTLPWLPSAVLDEASWRQFRRAAVFDYRKWDHQVGDIATIARAPLILTASAWAALVRAAEELSIETMALESELLGRSDLWPELGLSRAIRRALRASKVGPAVRVMRFDFHWTTWGWQISEVNADVPGGFNEAAMGALLLERYPSCRCVGDPAATLAASIAAQLQGSALVALVHATAYSDDRQVMEFLADACKRHGLRTRVCAPDHLSWNGEGCELGTEHISAIIRFFPGEWLPNLPRDSTWQHFAGHPKVLQANPLSALLTQSKRLPLVWSRLSTPTPRWRQLLPATQTTRSARTEPAEDWILKPVFGRVGEGVSMMGVSTPKTLRTSARAARWFPGSWIAQRKFTSVPWQGPDGPCHPCIGVYTIDGRIAGAYGRYTSAPLIDHQAVDVPVLVEAT